MAHQFLIAVLVEVEEHLVEVGPHHRPLLALLPLFNLKNTW